MNRKIKWEFISADGLSTIEDGSRMLGFGERIKRFCKPSIKAHYFEGEVCFQEEDLKKNERTYEVANIKESPKEILFVLKEIENV